MPNKEEYAQIKKIRTSEKITNLLSSIKHFKGKIIDLESFEEVYQIATMTDSLIMQSRNLLSKDELEYYTNLSVTHAKIIVELYHMPNDMKPKKLKEDVKKSPRNEKTRFALCFRDCFDIMARNGDFDSFLFSQEWNRSAKDKFYPKRRKVLRNHNVIQDLQDLHDKKIKMLIIEAPPGIGKTVIGESFCDFRVGLSPKSRVLIGNANASLTQGFYNDLVKFFTNPEYRHNDIFKNKYQILPNAENTAIYFNEKGREPNVLCRSIEVGATGLIHLDRNGLLYIDDIVKNSEQANNKDYLQKLIYMFTSTFFDRRDDNEVPVLVIGTPWSLYDLIAYLKKMFKGEDWFRVNSIPAYYIDDNGNKVTNFPYEEPHYKSIEYWEQQMLIEDVVISKAKFLMQPMEREGRPFDELEYFRMEDLKTRLKFEKPFIYNATDVAVKSGGDYMSSGFHYVFESTKEIYVVDLVYSNKGTDNTVPRIIKKYMEHNVERGEFEEKEGTVTGKINYGIGETIRKGLLDKGYRCHIGVHSGAGLKSKSTRIDTYATEIKGQQSISGYVIKYLHADDRKTNKEYNLAIEHLQLYSQSSNMQGKQIDDFPDMLSMGLTYCLKVTPKAEVKTYNIVY